jgi:hypothetical protein
MTFAEAVATLGLTGAGPFDREQVRRAYLRELKRHKPESDPAGFQRVRAAFELITSSLPAPASSVAMAPAPTVITPVTPLVEPREEVASAADDPLRSFRDRMEHVPEWQRVQVAREAVAQFPDSEQARELLLDELPTDARNEIIVVLLQGLAAGDPSSRERLLHFAPEALPDSEVERVAGEGTAFQRLRVAEGLVERRLPDRALALFEQTLADTTGLLASEAAGELPTPQALRVVLRFHRDGDRDRASRAFATLRRWMGPSSPPADTSDAFAAVALALVSELEACPLLPVELERELARGALEGDFSAVQSAAIVADRVHGARAQRRWRRQVRKNAPTIAAITAQKRLVMNWRWNRLGVLPLVSTFLFLLVSRGYFCERHHDLSSGRASFHLELSTTRAFRDLYSEFLYSCGRDRESPLCLSLAVVFRRATEQSYCKPLLAAMADLRVQAPQADAAAQQYSQRLLEHLSTFCGQ